MRKSFIRLLLVALLLAVFFQGHFHPISGQSGVSFSNPQVLQFINGRDDYPSTLQASNGTLWVVWQHYLYQIYYEKFDGTSWSPIRTLVTGTQFNIAPTITQLKNSTIIVFWSSNQTGRWNIYYQTLTGNLWTKAVQLTSGSFDDFFPDPPVAMNGTLWVSWERITSAGAVEQIYYKTLKGNVWSSDIPLTSDPTKNVAPGAMATFDGSIWVAWSKLNAKTLNYEIFYEKYNGTQWSSSVQLTSGNPFDIEPSLVQDRNGTLWMFWSREMQLTSGANALFQQKLFYKFSSDMGKTWSADTQLTFTGDATNPIDDLEPSAVQGKDRSIWVFFSSDLTNFGSDFDIYYVKSSPILTHDVAVTGLWVPPFQYPGGMKSVGESPVVKIGVIVSDVGDYNETVTASLTVYNATSYNLGTLTAAVTAGQSIVLFFSWNSTGIVPARYALSASVNPVPGELSVYLSGNSLVAKSILRLLPLGDVDQDGSVTITDISVAVFGYGASNTCTPGTTGCRWNPYADIQGDNIIDIVDIGVVMRNYGAII